MYKSLDRTNITWRILPVNDVSSMNVESCNKHNYQICSTFLSCTIGLTGRLLPILLFFCLQDIISRGMHTVGYGLTLWISAIRYHGGKNCSQLAARYLSWSSTSLPSISTELPSGTLLISVAVDDRSMGSTECQCSETTKWWFDFLYGRDFGKLHFRCPNWDIHAPDHWKTSLCFANGEEELSSSPCEREQN